jgi:hypothetical protein
MPRDGLNLLRAELDRLVRKEPCPDDIESIFDVQIRLRFGEMISRAAAGAAHTGARRGAAEMLSERRFQGRRRISSEPCFVRRTPRR